jgi:hypothetical protein
MSVSAVPDFDGFICVFVAEKRLLQDKAIDQSESHDPGC